MTAAKLSLTDKIIVTGAAGLVGQNLIAIMRDKGYENIVAIDKNTHNLNILRQLHPDITCIDADLSKPGDWSNSFAGAAMIAQLHAQIGGEEYAWFEANNITATQLVLDASKDHGIPYMVHISSSVVNSMAKDYYTETKKIQEAMVKDGPLPYCILRPTLMFGWFDRKHLGWLARFMARVPVFPIPGSGRYMRQPLYAGDFSRVVLSAMEKQPDNTVHDISGREKIDYIDIIRAMKRVTKATTPIIRIPYSSFWLMLKVYGLVDRNPPFTTRQLKALVTPDEFILEPWWETFELTPTSFEDAFEETFNDPRYADIVLKF
ncbi:MAG: NAD-dependent epimerase/dehydratase family protein [Rhodospirillaceae bacterium]